MFGPITYAISEIKQNGGRRTWWQNRIAARIVGPIQSQFYESDFRVVDEEWDMLLILDACRADLFEETTTRDRFDEYGRRVSAGSATNEWTRVNFGDEALTDTIYVTGNPVVSREVQTAFFKFIEVWREGFDKREGTVPPDAVTKAALEAHQEHPDKRIIVHYLQPHYPFIGHPELRFAMFGQTDELEVSNPNTGAKDVWEAVGLGMVSREEAWSAYRENLEIVLESIKPLIDAQSGRTVITSDHGNMIGERLKWFPVQLFGHPPNIHHPSLREVPWAVIEGEGGDQRVDEEQEVEIKEQLRNLGYVE